MSGIMFVTDNVYSRQTGIHIETSNAQRTVLKKKSVMLEWVSDCGDDGNFRFARTLGLLTGHDTIESQPVVHWDRYFPWN